MMTILEYSDIKKTRKPHRCFGCLEIIPAGSPAHLCVSSDTGTIFRSYTHAACETIMRLIDTYGDEGPDEGCVRDELMDKGFEGTPEEYVAQMEARS